MDLYSLAESLINVNRPSEAKTVLSELMSTQPDKEIVEKASILLAQLEKEEGKDTTNLEDQPHEKK